VGGSFCRQFAARPDLEIVGLGRRAAALGNYIQADLTQPLTLDWKPDVVIHAAARSSPWGALAEFRLQNVLATQNVVDFCAAQGVPKLVYISSSSVFYREEDQYGITEECPIALPFINAYAHTKYEGEEVVRQFAGDAIILRPRAVFGPHDTVLFPRILRAAREGRMAAITREGSPAIGDLIFVDSLCDYILRAALLPGLTGAINLTNAEPVEIEAFIANIFQKLGLPPVTRRTSRSRALMLASLTEAFYRIFRPENEPPLTRFGVGALAFSKTFDVKKCLHVLGPPSVSMENGVTRFVAWQKQALEAG